MSARRVEHREAGRYRYVVWVNPRTSASDALWGKAFEERALRSGHLAVIDGKVVEPGTPEARAAIAQLDAKVAA